MLVTLAIRKGICARIFTLIRQCILAGLVAIIIGGASAAVLYAAMPKTMMTAWDSLLGRHPSTTVSAMPTATISRPPATLLFQQFNDVMTSTQAQPIDTQSGLRLIISHLSINAPILERGIQNGGLVVAPGNVATHFTFSAYPGASGNSILYAHEGALFRHLDMLSVHDTIVIQTPAGTVAFQVRELRIVAPTNLSVLDSGTAAELTLITCYPYGVDSSRLVVIADKVHV